MKKFTQGERVIFEHKDKTHTGRVTALLPKRRRVVSDTGELASVPLGALRRAPDRVLMLEARLDNALRASKRIYGPMVKQWLEAYNGVEVLYERVHTVEDFRRFLHRDGRKTGTRFIHYNGHGQTLETKGAVLRLTFEDLDLREDIDVFEGLDGKVLIFSCCEVGANRQVMEHIKEASNAAAVIAYRTEVLDTYTNLAEALLYDRLFAGMKPQTAVNTVADGLHAMGIRTKGTRKPVLVCV